MTAPIWQHYLDAINTHPSTSAPRGQDAARVRQLLAELYRLGERPTRQEVSDYLRTRTVDRSLGSRQKAIVDLWAERLNHPHRRWRGGLSWSYPFVWADSYIAEHGLDSVATRLAGILVAAAREYAATLDRESGTDGAEAAAEELRHAHHALDVWGRILDREGKDWHGESFIPSPLTPSQRRHPFTKRGRRRLNEWLAQIGAGWEARSRSDDT